MFKGFNKLSYGARYAIWLEGTVGLAAGVGMLAFELTRHHVLIPSSWSPDLLDATTFGGLFALAVVIASGFFADRIVGEPPAPRPIIHVWTRNGVTAVCADTDYQIAAAEWERLTEAFWTIPCPQPRLVAYFTDDEVLKGVLGLYGTGTMADYENIAKECSVRKSEIFIWKSPKFESVHSRSFPLDLSTLKELIFGKS